MTAGSPFATVFQLSPEPMALLDADERVVDVNPAFARCLGGVPATFAGQRLAAAAGGRLLLGASGRQAAVAGRLPLDDGSGLVLLRLEPPDPLRRLTAAQGEILERVAAGAGLCEVLAALTQAFDALSPDYVASVRVLAADGRTLERVVAPALPEEVRLATQRVRRYVPEPPEAHLVRGGIYAFDLAEHPNYAGLLGPMHAAGIFALWNRHIVDAGGEVRGVFSVFVRHTRPPEPAELDAIDLASHLAAVAIGHAAVASASATHEARFRVVAELVSDWLWETDAEMRLTYFSDSFRRATGLEPADYLGRQTAEVVRAAGDEAQRRAQREALQARAPLRDALITVDHADGKPRWYRVNGLPRQDGAGRFLGYRGGASEVTERVLAEERAHAAEALLRRAIETVGEGFLLFDADDRLVLCNERARQMVPPAADLLVPGVAFEDYYRRLLQRGGIPGAGADVEAAVRARMAHRAAGGPPFEMETANGSWVRVDERRLPDGGAAIVWTDITELHRRSQQLEESERRYAQVTANVPALLFRRVRRPDGRYEYPFVGAGAQDLFGEPPEVLARDFERALRAVPEADLAAVAAATERSAATLEAWEVEFRLRPPDGRQLWVRGSGRPHRQADGSVVWDCILLDVTERKLAEMALEAAKEAAEQASRAKSDFLAAMSHELRTPLNAILGFAQILSAQMYGPLGVPRYREYADDIQESGYHLLQLINDILDLARLEAGRMTLDEEDVDLAELVEGSVRLMREQAERARLLLTVDPAAALPRVRADGRRLRQILLNLLSNAIKFTPPGGSVTVHSLREPEALCLSVSDSGIGIPEADIPKALSLFGQVEGTWTRRHEGSGLGLPVCKALAELHGGSLDLQSVYGDGTRVSVRLPATRLLAPRRAPHAGLGLGAQA